MTTGKRLAMLAAVIVIAIVAFVVLKPESSSNTAATVAQVNVKGGKPVGGIKKIAVNKGATVRFTVSSDLSDKVHVHGYDFKKDVKAGGSVTFSFPAKIDGVFEIELEGAGEQIASLEVQP